MRLLTLVLSTVLGFAAFSRCQQSQQDSLDGYPSCAKPCIVNAVMAGPCSATDMECICSNETFQNAVTLCVQRDCSVIEGLATRNLTLTNCHVPVRDRSDELIKLTIAMAVLAAVFVATRFAYKIFVVQIDMGMDDWFILASLVCAVISTCVIVIGMASNGLGKDIWTLPADQITHILRYFYIATIGYFLEAALVKLSIISFFMRIFPAKDIQRLLWITFAFTALWGFTFVIVGIFQCRPVSYFWTKWDGKHHGQCVAASTVAWANAGVNIALDIWILGVPLWQLKNLQLHWKKKIGVALMFSVGAFVTVMSVLRLNSLVIFAQTANVTWEFFPVSMWSTIEISVAIMCACLPTVRLLLVKIFPILAGTSRKASGSYSQRYGSRGPSGVKSAGKSFSSRAVAASKHESVVGKVDNSRIGMTRSFTVQYSDSDEISLVSTTPVPQDNNRP